MTTPTFVYDLPYGVRSDLVASLDAGDAWRDLAGRRLGYDHLQIQRFSDARHKSGTSPADALLTHWGQRNGMVEELFKHLHAMQLYQSMVVIKPCVPKGLHGFMQVWQDIALLIPVYSTVKSRYVLMFLVSRENITKVRDTPVL